MAICTATPSPTSKVRCKADSFGAKADQLAGTYSAAGKNQRDEDVVARGVFGAKRQDAAQAGGQPDAPVAKPDAPEPNLKLMPTAPN